MAGVGLMWIAPAASADGDALVSEIHYAGGDDADFVELEGPQGTDISGWVLGSITRGDRPHTADHVVTVPDGTVIPESGALAIDVPITNSTTGGYGSSVFAVDAAGELMDFWTIGFRPDSNGGVDGGSTAGDSALLPEAVRGESARPTDVTAASGSQSIQLVDGEWVSSSPTKGARNGDDGQPGQPGVPDEDTHTIAEIQGEGAESALVGQTVTTSGVVTAAYPVGGFDGYYIQTAGSGGDTDLTERTASDGIFVYSPQTAGSVEVGDHVRVAGEVEEHFGLTEIVVGAEGLEISDEPAAAVKPIEFELPATDEDREPFEGMVVSPVDGYVVSDTYALGGWGTNAFGSIGLGLGGPLLQETDVARPGTPEYDEVVADNAARAVTLDDGQSARTSSDQEVPYLTADTPVRTGVELTFVDDVIFDYRFQWNFQPTRPVNGDASDIVLFDGGDTRDRNEQPAEVGGDVGIATFNVLNYFTTLGVDLDGCTAYTDRDGNPLTVRGGCDARGAWDQENLDRQEAKIVAAINALDADVVALQEIENSARFGKDRDAALAALVDALNEDAPDTWAYAESPDQVPAPEDEDVIRNAFIYKPDAVEPAGDSAILIDDSAFSNAREPLAQQFTVRETGYSFIGIVNHFKSKGGDCSDDIPEGCHNADRVAQAESLVEFAEDVATEAGTDDVFLIGDFNAYGQEDPIHVFREAGYTDLATEFAAGTTYVFDGKVGSLDHVLASSSVLDGELVRGVDVWNINSVESVLMEYSRYNYFASELFEPGTVWRASDHDPILVGIGPEDGGGDPGDETGDDDGSEGGTDGGAESGDDGGADDGSDAGSESGLESGGDAGTDVGAEDGGDNGADDDGNGDGGIGDDGSGHDGGGTDDGTGADGDLPDTGSGISTGLMIAGMIGLAGGAGLYGWSRRSGAPSRA
ncbi:ExeM/NucH family extracellular endonuclease [Phytoactinopolyspora halotolerans]|uniref:ExeM/NucH family extracellular endonuclease n=1 Tax=Phytoactinopolyspora halotolerans TaxID=1981512 RepID=A0A6L9S3K2_9ACTN|nr:ExeM/NucH family extracellular endonuclease [Phytoactinopolyspora halotolerans]NED99410.1 ExeM/NucH family extracellular endonuclease [Phytoactinopolyspora halotolerans]